MRNVARTDFTYTCHYAKALRELVILYSLSFTDMIRNDEYPSREREDEECEQHAQKNLNYFSETVKFVITNLLFFFSTIHNIR